MSRAAMKPIVTAAVIAATIAVSAGVGAEVKEPARTVEPGSAIEPPRETRDRPPPVQLPRGQLLYENHCQGCHASTVHIRDPQKRKARSLVELRAQITRWAAELRLDWRDEDIADVQDYLNRRYYQLAPPTRRN